MVKLKNIFVTVFSKHNRQLRKSVHNAFALVFCSFFLSIISLILTILNIVNDKTLFVTICTSILVVGFVISGLLSIFKKTNASSYLLMLMITLIFSLFALTGENDGFAILWILLVPLVAMNLLSFELGFVLSSYFLIFLFVIFYTPIKNMTLPSFDVTIGEAYHTNTFLIRFPLLYFASFGGTAILALQKEYYFVQKGFQAYTDGLTNVLNRACFINDVDTNLNRLNSTFISFDLNSLKEANDMFGHEAGDLLIKSAADALKATWNDTTSKIYRLGGDEFTVVTLRSYEQTLVDVERFRKLIDDMNSGSEVKLSVSIGIASSDKDGTLDPWELSRLSDANMYRAKEIYYSEVEHERRSHNKK